MKGKIQPQEFNVNESSEQDMPKRNITHAVNLGGTEGRVSGCIKVYSSDLQPRTSHCTHELITKILWHAKTIFFCQSDKNRYNFDLFTKTVIVITRPFFSKVTSLKN